MWFIVSFKACFLIDFLCGRTVCWYKWRIEISQLLCYCWFPLLSLLVFALWNGILLCIIKSRDIALSSKFRLAKAMVFPVVCMHVWMWELKLSEELMLEAETPLLWPPDVEIWLIGKDPDAGKESGQEEKGTREDEMVGWHHRLNQHECE